LGKFYCLERDLMHFIDISAEAFSAHTAFASCKTRKRTLSGKSPGVRR
jgi:hypothetical protein